MTPRNPIEFVRMLANGNRQLAGNRVQLEDANGNPITTLNPVSLGGTVAIDQTSPNNEVHLLPGEHHAAEVGFALNVTAPVVITRTTNNTPYTVNQRVGETGAVTAPKEITGIARIAGGSGVIVGIRIRINLKSITPRFRVHFFNASTVTLAADGADWKEVYADAEKYVGYKDMDLLATAKDTANSDCSRTQAFDFAIPYKCAAGSTSLWFAYQTLDAFTPAGANTISLVVKAELY